MKFHTLSMALVVGLLAVASSQAAEPSAAQRQFESLKKLAGDWVELKDGKPGDTVMSSFRVTAAGSAIEEKIMPGSDHEMVTMYHLDGDHLILTHYCALGNQPRLKAEPGSDPNTIVFKFQDATNLKDPHDQHMHDATFTIVSPDRFKAVWKSMDGETCPEAAVELVRKKN